MKRCECEFEIKNTYVEFVVEEFVSHDSLNLLLESYERCDCDWMSRYVIVEKIVNIKKMDVRMFIFAFLCFFMVMLRGEWERSSSNLYNGF